MVTESPKPPTVDTFNQVVTSGGPMPQLHVILVIALKMETMASKQPNMLALIQGTVPRGLVYS